MNDEEYRLNRQILLDINQKKKIMQQELEEQVKPSSRGVSCLALV